MIFLMRKVLQRTHRLAFPRIPVTKVGSWTNIHTHTKVIIGLFWEAGHRAIGDALLGIVDVITDGVALDL